MRTSAVLRVCACVLGLIATPAAARNIDTFTVGPIGLSVAPNQFPPPNVQTGLDAAQVFGGSRWIGINGIQGTGKTGNVLATADAATSALQYDARNASPGLIESFRLGTGDADWFNGPGAFSANLLGDGGDAFVIPFESAHFVNSQGTTVAAKSFSLLVASGIPGSRTGRAAVFDVAASETPQTIVLPFSAFPAGTDFTKVAAVELLTVNLGGGTHFRIDSITTTPEPAALGLLALVPMPLQRRPRERQA